MEHVHQKRQSQPQIHLSPAHVPSTWKLSPSRENTVKTSAVFPSETGFPPFSPCHQELDRALGHMTTTAHVSLCPRSPHPLPSWYRRFWEISSIFSLQIFLLLRALSSSETGSCRGAERKEDEARPTQPLKETVLNFNLKTRETFVKNPLSRRPLETSTVFGVRFGKAFLSE